MIPSQNQQFLKSAVVISEAGLPSVVTLECGGL